MRRRFRVYIVGHIPTVPTITTFNKFNSAAKELEALSCEFYNPITAFENSSIPIEDVLKNNLQELLLCNAVYIMNDRNVKLSKLIDVRIAITLNYVIMNQPQFFINVDEYAAASVEQLNTQKYPSIIDEEISPAIIAETNTLKQSIIIDEEINK